MMIYFELFLILSFQRAKIRENCKQSGLNPKIDFPTLYKFAIHTHYNIKKNAQIYGFCTTFGRYSHSPKSSFAVISLCKSPYCLPFATPKGVIMV